MEKKFLADFDAKIRSRAGKVFSVAKLEANCRSCKDSFPWRIFQYFEAKIEGLKMKIFWADFEQFWANCRSCGAVDFGLLWAEIWAKIRGFAAAELLLVKKADWRIFLSWFWGQNSEYLWEGVFDPV